MTAIRVGHLYPEYLNIYADRGNIAVFANRARWRGLELGVEAIGPDDDLRPGEHDLLYIGGGQDRERGSAERRGGRWRGSARRVRRLPVARLVLS